MSVITEVLRGTTEPIGVYPYRIDGALVTGATLTVSISRTSDGKSYDFADDTFKTSPGQATQALTPIASGNYEWAWDMGAITNPVAAGVPETYVYEVVDQTNSLVLDDVSGELRVRAADAIYNLAAGVATSVELTSATSTINGHTDSAASALATAASLATAQASLDAIQGVGFTGSTDSLRALRARGDSAWVTATGFAQPGDAMALTLGERSAVQALILSDATPFPGAHIDAAVSSLPDAATIASTLLDAALAGHGTAGSAGAALGLISGIPASVWSAGTRTLTAATNLTALASQASVDALATAVGAIPTTTPLDATATAAAVWNALAASYTGVGSFGRTIGTNLDATVGSRAADGAQMALTGSAITAVQAGLATSAELTAAEGNILAAMPAAAPDAATVAAAVNSSLSGAHGAGAWTTADVSSLATSAQVSSGTSTVTAAISASQTAIVAAISALSIPGASTIAAAVAAVDVSALSNRLTLGGAINALRKLGLNRLVASPGSPGTVTIYEDDGTTPAFAASETDALGQATTSPTGAPARRSAFA